MDEFIEIQSSTGTWYQRWLVRFKSTFKQVWLGTGGGGEGSPVGICRLRERSAEPQQPQAERWRGNNPARGHLGPSPCPFSLTVSR